MPNLNPTPKGNTKPKWQRDELILALDLYFRHPPLLINKTHPEVLRLSEVLNSLPIHPNRPDVEKFRNPNGVYMKLCNFLRFDPSYEGTGLTRGGKLEEAIWKEFSEDRQQLKNIAHAIVDGSVQLVAESQTTDEDENEFPEGRVLYRTHRARERNTKLVNKAKSQALKKNVLYCCICKFDFFKEYGEIGKGYIECHHTKPISDYKAGEKTRISDLALVCANCHRMLHRRRPWLTIRELNAIKY